VVKIEDGYQKTGLPNSITMMTPTRTYFMFAESSQDRDDWMIELTKCSAGLEKS